MRKTNHTTLLYQTPTKKKLKRSSEMQITLLTVKRTHLRDKKNKIMSKTSSKKLKRSTLKRRENHRNSLKSINKEWRRRSSKLRKITSKRLMSSSLRWWIWRRSLRAESMNSGSRWKTTRRTMMYLMKWKKHIKRS